MVLHSLLLFHLVFGNQFSRISSQPNGRYPATEEHAAAHGEFGGITPSHYDATFYFSQTEHPGLNEPPKYQGKIAMQFSTSHRDIDTVKLLADDAWGLSVSSNATLFDGPWGFRANVTRDRLRPFISVKLDRLLKPAHDYTLQLDFEGQPSTSDQFFSPPHNYTVRLGLLYREYELKNETHALMYVTVYQQRFARTVMPCIDVPSMKATFGLTLVHPKAYKALSGQPVEKAEFIGSSELKTMFKTTARIPTYNMVFALIHNYYVDSMEYWGLFPKAKPITTTYYLPDYSTANRKQEKLREVLPIMAYVVEQYFGSPISLSKMDLLLNISQFVGSDAALENEGLIIFAAPSFRGDPRRSQTLLHEFVHHWLGNRVTVSTFGEIDLQEGITEFLSYHLGATNGLLRDKMRTGLVPPWIVIFGRLMGQELSGGTPIRDLFDQFERAYDKPPHIMNMLANLIGPIQFRDAVRDLVNTAPDSLISWEFFEEILAKYNKRASEFCRAWRALPDFPVISVRNNPNTTEVEINQLNVFQNETNFKPFPILLDVVEMSLEPECELGKKKLILYDTFPNSLSKNNSKSLILADPAFQFIQLPLYDLKTYSTLFDPSVSCMSPNDTVQIAYQFRMGVGLNLLPLEKDPSTDIQHLSTVAEAYATVLAMESPPIPGGSPFDLPQDSRFCSMIPGGCVSPSKGPDHDAELMNEETGPLDLKMMFFL